MRASKGISDVHSEDPGSRALACVRFFGCSEAASPARFDIRIVRFSFPFEHHAHAGALFYPRFANAACTWVP